MAVTLVTMAFPNKPLVKESVANFMPTGRIIYQVNGNVVGNQNPLVGHLPTGGESQTTPVIVARLVYPDTRL